MEHIHKTCRILLDTTRGDMEDGEGGRERVDSIKIEGERERESEGEGRREGEGKRERESILRIWLKMFLINKDRR